MPSDDWWTGSEAAGAQRSADMGAPLPPRLAVDDPWGRDARNMSVMSGGQFTTHDALAAMVEAEAERQKQENERRKATERAGGIYQAPILPAGHEASTRLWHPIYGRRG